MLRDASIVDVELLQLFIVVDGWQERDRHRTSPIRTSRASVLSRVAITTNLDESVNLNEPQ